MINREEVISGSQEFICPIEKTRLTMCTLARLLPVKGVERLIPVLARLKKEGLDFHQWIIGEGYQKKIIQQLIEKFDLKDTVFLLGFQKNPFPYLKASDIFVSTSFLEGLPLAIGKALCLGKPVVATNVSGTAEILGYGAYGMLVDSNEDAICEGLKEMMSNEALRNDYAMKAATGAMTEIFDIPKTMSRINELLHHTTTAVRTPLECIAHLLIADNDTNNNPGLMNGKMGKAVFYFHYAAFTGNKLYEAFAFDLIDEMVQLIHYETPVDYAGGLAGIGAGVEYLAQNGFIEADTDDILEEIEQQIYLSIPYETNGTNLAGTGLYLLFRLRNAASGDHKHTTLENKIFLIHIIDLIERLYPQQSEESLACIYRFLTEADKTNIFPAKVKRLLKEFKLSNSKLLTANGYRQQLGKTFSHHAKTVLPSLQGKSASDTPLQLDGGLPGIGLYLMSTADSRHKSWLQLIL